MRLLFPDHIPLVPAFYFAAFLCAIQQVQGTNATFSLCCFFYIIVATVAFNVAGGFTRPSGAFIFFNSTLSVIVALCIKAYLAEPADSNLMVPFLSIRVLLFGMCMMLVAVFLSRRVSAKRAFLGKMVTDANMQTATVGTLVIGSVIGFATLLFTLGNGSVLSALNQLNRFLPLAIILGVINSIRRSGGTRSVNLPTLIAGGIVFVFGVLGFSKEGMFAPFVCWIIAAASQRYKVTLWQVFGMLLATLFIFHYLVPYSQYGRTFKEENGEFNVATSLHLLSNLDNVREQYIESSADQYEDRVVGYFNTPEGLFDRLQMISMDDALINRTDQFGNFGIYPIFFSLENLVPHFIWKDKPSILIGNVFAHEVGLLSDTDESTGVSFSSTSTAYHLIGWPGIFLLAPVIWFSLFTIFDSLCGDTRKSPWGLLVILLFAHAAPEADISTLIYTCFYSAISIVFAAVVGAYVAPIIGTFLIGPERTTVQRTAPVRSIPGRMSPMHSSEG